MEKTELIRILSDLKELKFNLLCTNTIRKERSRNKAKNDAILAISYYAHYLPGEVRAYLDTHVQVNALSYKWVEGDINDCIKVIENWISTMPDDGPDYSTL